MDYDQQLAIAVGTTRKQKVWKNTTMLWSELLNKLSNTTRTPETVEEYFKLPKSRQDEIKDVGGFVGGYLIKGSRTHVKYRQIVCLDIDYGSMSLWDSWELLYGNASCIYSTHKHTPSNPRLRLIIPLNRKVSPDEYEAIARKIAQDLDINAFDDTTYQAQRLMYWPSSSIDGEYTFHSIEAEFLNADHVLNRYEDWTDITSWPTSNRSHEIIQRSIKKQQNPLDKNGLVGAFCRSYTIHEAIATFIEDYVSCDVPNRYTYSKGSTSAGIITYDDLFSYSHHATDPASGILCNAFDLVRLHRFKELDEKTDIDLDVTKLPSYKAMTEFASKDVMVKKEIIKAREQLITEFEIEENTKQSKDWQEKLQINKQGSVISNYYNIELILKHDPYFKDKFGYDELANREVAIVDLPWRKVSPSDSGLKDIDDASIRSYFDKRYGITGKDKIYDGVQVVARRHSFHPVKDYLESLEWDGVQRIDTMLIDYFACEDNKYTRAVTRKTLLGAISRIYHPGCHFDTMLTLKGPQGCGKSSFFRKLAGAWFTDSLKDIRNKDALEGLQGIWIVEMGELTALKKADAETIKSFLSGTTDRFRKAYGRRTENYPRQCIFVATTNESEFLRDKTGNRRFWIVEASKSIKPRKNVFKLKQEDFDQFWAEAKVLYDAGVEDLVLSKEIEKMAIEMQESYMVEDPKEQQILDYLNRRLPKDWDNYDLYERQAYLVSDKVGSIERDKVCVAEVWCEALGHDDTKKLNQYETLEINRILDKLPNWEKQKNPLRFKLYGQRRGYKRIN
mgnify:CR=1 FL=1